MTERDNLLRYFRFEDCDHEPTVEQMNVMAGSDEIAIVDIPVRERPLHGSGFDIFGVHWSATNDVSHYTPKQKPIYDDIEDWHAQVRFPDIEKFEWEQLRADAARIDRSKQLVSVVMYCGPFERTTMLTSMEDCLVNLISDPEDFADLIGAITDYKIALVHKIWDCAQPDMYLLHDDWGTAKSTFMSPKLWREVIKPHTKRLYDAVHSHGALVIQHSCGAVGPLVGDMAELGADAWDGQPECNDFAALRASYGDRLRILDKPPMPDTAEGAPLMPNEKYGAYADYPEFLFEGGK